jgi:hypothetical protein
MSGRYRAGCKPGGTRVWQALPVELIERLLSIDVSALSDATRRCRS